MEVYMPYVASVLCAVISGMVTYVISRRQTKLEVEKLIKQHELDLEKEKEKHKYELELQELNHKHQLEIQEKEFENKLSSDMMNTMISEAMKTPEVRRQISQGMTNTGRKNHR